jgi:hypothetical protein
MITEIEIMGRVEDRCKTEAGLAASTPDLSGNSRKVWDFLFAFGDTKMGIPLIIDEQALAKLRAFGESHRIDQEEVRKIIAGTSPCAGDREGHSLNMEVGYRVVFSIEEAPLTNGSGSIWLRRMSMSLNAPGRVPNPVAVSEVGKLLGFPPLNDCTTGLDSEVVMVAVEEKSAT